MKGRVRRPAPGPASRRRGVAGRLRALVVPAAVLALVAASRPTTASVLAGLPFLLAGLITRAWAAGHLVKTRELVTSGPYRFVQHPLYLGRLLLGLGLCIMARRDVVWGGVTVPLNLVVLALFVIVFFGYYVPRKRRVEGERLRRIHGQAYVDWAGCVPAVLPRLTPAPSPSRRRWSAARWRALREHWFALVTALVVAVLAIRAR